MGVPPAAPRATSAVHRIPAFAGNQWPIQTATRSSTLLAAPGPSGRERGVDGSDARAGIHGRRRASRFRSGPERTGRTDVNKSMRWSMLAPAMLMSLSLSPGALAQQGDAASMTFFLTSVGPGNGADLGGLEGANQHCQQLAAAVGAGSRTWRAYLSTQASGGAPAVDARDRIGGGPWQNAEGVVIADDLDQLHGGNNLTKDTAL